VTSRFVWEASVHTGRTRNTAPAAPGRLGNEHRNHQAHLDERVRRGYHPRRGGRYDSGEDRSPTPEPPCRRFDPGGSLDRRVNCRRVSQPRWVGARRSTKGGRKQAKRGNPRPSCCPTPRSGALAVGGYKRPRGRERGTCVSARSPARPTFSYESPGPSFYRSKERAQVYNGGCISVLTCLAERS
jgi:hypothetical protein